MAPKHLFKCVLTSSANLSEIHGLLEEKKLVCTALAKPFKKEDVVHVFCSICRAYDSKEHFDFELMDQEMEVNVVELPIGLPQKNLHTDKPVVLITGASSGIGAALAKELNENQKYRLVLTARQRSIPLLMSRFRESELLKIVPLDLTNPQEITRCVNGVISDWGRIDMLINNAGVCFRAATEQMDAESEMIQMQTNYLGPMALIRAVIPVMREQGQGSTFAFTFFVEQTLQLFSVPEGMQTQVDSEMAKSSPFKILVADDNSTNQLLARKFLEKLGYYPDIVSNGFEVLEAVKLKKYDVILMDGNMPELDGFETTQALCQQMSAQKIPWIVGVSASASKQ